MYVVLNIPLKVDNYAHIHEQANMTVGGGGLSDVMNVICKYGLVSEKYIQRKKKKLITNQYLILK